MNSIAMSLLGAGCIVAGTLIGILLRSRLPGHHFSPSSKTTIRMAAGFIGTLAAMVLGLLVASAKSSFDLMNNETTQAGAKVILLDDLLLRYGPEAQPARDQLKHSVNSLIEKVWPSGKMDESDLTALEHSNGMERVQEKLSVLVPQDDYHRALLTQAYQISNDLLQTRWLLIEQAQGSLPVAVFIILLFWLTMLYISIGLFAPANPTVIGALLVTALSFSAAIFLILEMNRPLGGFIKLSDGPMVKAREHLNR